MFLKILFFGVYFSFLFIFSPQVEAAFSATLSAFPASGQAPLNNVSLTAQVSGDVQGNINYSFDCASDGSFERVILTSSLTVSVGDLCSYPLAGNYMAKVEVETVDSFTIAAKVISVSSPPLPPAPSPEPASSGQTPTLSVSLTANPASGFTPLLNVSLTAQVSGAAQGNINYSFDCTSDGSFERTVLTSSDILTVNSLCQYNNPGNYTALVQADREGVFRTAIFIVRVSEPADNPPDDGGGGGGGGFVSQPQPQPQPQLQPAPVAPTLFVSLTASPVSGQIPLVVSLTAQVSGTAQGSIRYSFDCTSDGVFELQSALTDQTTFTAPNLCLYSSPGNFIARVRVERAGLQNTASANISAQEAPIVQPVQPTLFVTLISRPTSGSAPLFNVSLIAQVTGTSRGSIIYRFSCGVTSVFDRTFVSDAETFTAENLCGYINPGNYLARVQAERAGLAAMDALVIPVSVFSAVTPVQPAQPGGQFSLDKFVRNKSRAEVFWQDSISAFPGQELEFRILVRANQGTPARNIIIIDTPPPGLIFNNDLRVNGAFQSVNNIASGLRLGEIPLGGLAEITFSARIAGSQQFGALTTNLLNFVSASNVEKTQTQSAKISVNRLNGAIVQPVTPLPTVRRPAPSPAPAPEISKEEPKPAPGEEKNFLASLVDSWPFRNPIWAAIIAGGIMLAIILLRRRASA